MPIQKLRPTFTFDQDRIEQLRAIAPEAFADGKINWDVLKEALGENLEDESPNAEHFGLFWPGKREARRFASKPSGGTLIPARGEGVDEETTHNIFIEGDNLEVLKLLQKSYAGQVKMIYIDPPYNTGNDFVYIDNFSESPKSFQQKVGDVSDEGLLLTTNSAVSGRFHTNWLNMIYPRLRTARALLKDGGFIFVSIDDNESYHLRLVMNEIFGEENFVTTLIWKRRQQVDSRAKTGISVDHEYVLIYSKTEDTKLRGRPKDLSKYNNPDNDPRGPWSSDNLLGLATKEQRPNLHYALINPDTGITYPTPETGWRYSKTTMAQLIQEGRILWPSSPTGRPRYKRFLNDMADEFTGLSSVLSTAFNSEATRELKEIFDGKDIMDFPKPVAYMKLLVQQATQPSEKDIVLDFFAGSGTTAQAVLELNHEDNGNRQFICVQVPEPTSRPEYSTIAEIGKERIRRVSKKLKKEKAKGDLGFRVFKLAPSNFKQWHDYDGHDVDALETRFAQFETPLVKGWTRENLLTEIILQQGFPLDSTLTPQKEFTKNEIVAVSSPASAHQLFVCLDEKIHDATIKQLKLAKRDVFICLDSALSSEAKVRLGDATNLVVI